MPVISGKLKSTQLDTRDQPVPKEHSELLQNVTQPHVASFNFFINDGLDLSVADLDPVETTINGQSVVLRITQAALAMPTAVRRGAASASSRLLMPTEARQRRVSYKADLGLTIVVKVDGGETWTIERVAGQVPIMVKSDRCYLKDMSPAELVRHHEESNEMGGYFIINGNEKIVRMLLLPRRNYPMALIRPSFANRGKNYTEFGVQIRCVRPDQSAKTITLHGTKDGSCVVGFSYRKQQYLIPAILIMRALADLTDKEIFDAVVQGDRANSFLVERAQLMIRSEERRGLYSSDQCLSFLGKRLRIAFGLPSRMSNVEAGLFFLRKTILVHISEEDRMAKFRCLALMARKLYLLEAGHCSPDNADSPMNQELLLPGHLYGAFVKEQMHEYLVAVRKQMETDARLGRNIDLSSPSYIEQRVLSRAPDIGRKVEYLMSTGNLASPTGLDQMQVSGFTIVADKLNFLRYLSHFRCVHRGAYFSQMKTTSVRKLLPESWGFMCPVHTPDGSPCGLLNHLARHCFSPVELQNIDALPKLLLELGVSSPQLPAGPSDLVVMLDGVVQGYAAEARLRRVAEQLRVLKVNGDERVPNVLEIALVPTSKAGQYPGLFLFTTPARMVRPVKNLRCSKQEYVSTFEQVYMDIAVAPEEFVPNVTTHMELSKHGFLSIVASFTPFSDFNQSPRNMYQCQMGKQTMAVPAQTIPFRSDNKLYCLNTGQTPLVRPRAYDEYKLDNYPIGTNAIVAVIAYTGYDMEDAMIVNKASAERGFANARVVATKLIDLTERKRPGEAISHRFGLPKIINGRPSDKYRSFIDEDGLPMPAVRIKEGDPFYCVIDMSTGEARIEKYKGEPATIERVAVLSTEVGAGRTCIQRITVTLAVNRNPIIGDKFASRHGQKGILSQLWPQEDMPFTESGMMPDILFNPHGFPSRMTIGMLIESMAGKSACLHGITHDATPFQFDEEQNAVDYFGEQLRRAGYNFYGHERLYSGVTGEEFDVDIFIGNVYYQRLRHMVSDKYQVRTTGPVHNLTRQPIKGRKRAGGIRFGEMERDALLGHGVSFMLQDRLVHCSDESEADVCRTCGSLVSPILEPPSPLSRRRLRKCAVCDEKGDVVRISVPYVFRYLTAELMAMNIRISLDVAET